MMIIPGINNLDTYRYICQSMYGTYKRFSLDALCKEESIPSPREGFVHRLFSEAWFMESRTNASDMVTYNIGDCIATLDLCAKLDLINQIVSLCYTAKAWVSDVLAYNTGTMASSCLCSHAHSRGYSISWTRCDWKPENFKGGEVIYTGPSCASNVMIVDFVSIYPSIMSSCGISPECIDYIDPDDIDTCRFNSWGFVAIYKTVGTKRKLVAIFYGIRAGHGKRPEYATIVGEEYSVNSTVADSEQAVVDYLTQQYINMSRCDSTLRGLRVVEAVVGQETQVISGVLKRRDILERLAELEEHTLFSDKPFQWNWIPDLGLKQGYSVDWMVSGNSHSTVVNTPDYRSHSTYGPRVSARACR